MKPPFNRLKFSLAKRLEKWPIKERFSKGELLRKLSKPYVLENLNFVNFAHNCFLKLPTVVIVFILVIPKINFSEVLLFNENALFF